MQVVFKFTVANQPIVGFAKISVGERQMHLWKSVFNMIWLDIAQIQVMLKFWVADQPIVMTQKKNKKKTIHNRLYWKACKPTYKSFSLMDESQ